MQPMQAQGWRHWRGSAGKGPARACTGCATLTSAVLPPCLRVWARGQTSRRLAPARFFREGREPVGPPGQPGPGAHTAAQAKAGGQEAASTVVSDIGATTAAADPSPDAAATAAATLTPAAPGRDVSPVGAAASPSAPQPPGFQPRRLLVFSCLVLGYAGYYLTRNSLTYTAPVMVADPSLGFSLAQVGTMTSIFPIAYGLSKFVSGIVGDRYSPSLLLGGGLIATAACNLAFGAAGSLHMFAAMWALNGLMQGVGAPSCARMLTSWFAARERGTYWGLWNVAHNTGGFAAPLVAATAANALGWRWGMWAPGLAGLVLGAYVLLLCKDTPQDAGFPPVEAAPTRNQQPQQTSSDGNSNSSTTTTTTTAAATTTSGSSSSSSSSGSSSSSSSSSSSQPPGVLRAALDNVLSNPAVWALAFVYFFVYVVRQGVTSWSMFYLMREKGVADAAQAAARVSGLELGGLVGGLAAGRLSDILIRRSAASGQGSVGVRVKVVMAYTAGLAASLLLFQSLPPGTAPLLQWLSVAAIGFCIYGPQMLVGLCGAELVHPASVGASQGVLGWIAYLGAANAGVPLSLIIERYGWSAYFATLLGACGLALALLAPLSGLSSFAQRQHRHEQEQMQAAAGSGGEGGGRGDGDGVGQAKLA